MWSWSYMNGQTKQSQTWDIRKILFQTLCVKNWKISKKSLKNAEKSCDPGHIRMVKPSKAKLEIFAQHASEKIASLQKSWKCRNAEKSSDSWWSCHTEHRITNNADSNFFTLWYAHANSIAPLTHASEQQHPNSQYYIVCKCYSMHLCLCPVCHFLYVYLICHTLYAQLVWTTTLPLWYHPLVTESPVCYLVPYLYTIPLTLFSICPVFIH